MRKPVLLGSFHNVVQIVLLRFKRGANLLRLADVYLKHDGLPVQNTTYLNPVIMLLFAVEFLELFETQIVQNTYDF